ncbi:MAG: CRISPR-associated endonuclease Cas1 [Methylovulum sp.]|uniref:CRISPR-associated endonuclease Cas1 n=1 Tax=Methylovulum sp. TaxID=1916980 RepID=UPI00262C6804|nr:CRISPR-associated endonuclease Cas1 [Methylovulum sp.]MDD2725264.1 CRISPR-associated endonuclease Cas1 [Methylovulum sp.]
MKTLIIDKDHSELHYQGGNLTVYTAGKRVSTVPVRQLERVIVSPQVTITAGVLGVIAEQHVSLMVLNARLPARTATLAGHHSGDHQRRLAQYQCSLDQAFCVQIATRLIAMKIGRQRTVLQNALQKRPELRRVLTKAIKQLETASTTLTASAHHDLTVLNGIEGAAARAYFQAYTQLFCPRLNFTGRNRRPPLDPVNAILSLSYTLLHHEAVNALKIYGLDPSLGFYHQTYYGRDSLACDVIEPLRPYLDKWIWRLFAGQTLTDGHFVYDGPACLLADAGKPIFYKGFFTEAKALKRLLRHYALHLVNTLHEAQAHG